ncbi:hypothetical protein BDW66DRAFT_133328 [Aspergillus desertorum]
MQERESATVHKACTLFALCLSSQGSSCWLVKHTDHRSSIRCDQAESDQRQWQWQWQRRWQWQSPRLAALESKQKSRLGSQFLPLIEFAAWQPAGLGLTRCHSLPPATAVYGAGVQLRHGTA